ncbi:tripartite tricarboxylate transporter TctB family protein [Polycladidibacter hongkongensis]|uniref:tripartite tricarboxylate transporter TctB family protein n=1 Tax=Polycladidibacter hongkongensis TaxID=1647556 RepID=UPI000834C981|nr:tripartite tricarboxylate transporter TctB family protein [Pseudovibrio hongkongensis]
MSNSRDEAIGSLCFAALGGGIAAAFYAASLSLPPPMFEPVGSAFVPQVFAVVIWACAVTEAVRTTRIIRMTAGQKEPGQQTSFIASMLAKAGYILFFAAILLVFDSAWVPFSLLAALLFIGTTFACGLSITRRSLLNASILGLAFGLMLELVFTKVFFVNIPSIG